MDIRETVLNKYKGKCAYCGKELTIKTLQVDHIIPKYLGGKNTLENYNPSCRRCNRRKATFSIEEFREEINKQVNILHKYTAGYRLVKDYNLIKETNKETIFYFERLKILLDI